MRRVDLTELKERLLAGATVAELSAAYGIGETTCKRRIRDLCLTESEETQVRLARKKGTMVGVPARFSGNNEALREIRDVLGERANTPSNMEGMSPAEKGRIGELFVKYVLARMGVQYADMPYNTDDIIVKGSDGSWKRCEIKTASKGYNINTRRTRYRGGEFVTVAYENIDFFILVAMETEEIFIIPAADVEGKHYVCCSPFGIGWKYRFKIDQF